MSNTVMLKDNHIHITYDVYDYGLKEKRKIIPVEDIECIKANIGPRGGMHTWSLRGYSPEYKDFYEDRDAPIFSGDRKNADLIEKIVAVLPKCNYHTEVEDSGASW